MTKPSSKLKVLMKEECKMDEQSLIPYIERLLRIKPNVGVYEVHDTEKKPDKFYHPSGDCMKCMRRLYFEKAGKAKAEEFPVSTRLAFSIGHAVHGMLQAWVEAMNSLDGFPKSSRGPEFKVYSKEHNVRGSVDDIIIFPGCDTEVPIDYKTMSSRQFELLQAPKSEHILQIRVYLDLLDLPYGILLYIEKDSPHRMKEFRVDRKSVEHVYNRWRAVTEALVLNSPDSLDFECEVGTRKEQWCPASGVCR